MATTKRTDKDGTEYYRATVYHPLIGRDVSVARWCDGRSRYKTQTAAQRAVDRAKAAIRREVKGERERKTIEELYDLWIAEAMLSVKPRTLEAYQVNTKRFRKTYGSWFVDEFGSSEAVTAARRLTNGQVRAVRIMFNRAVAHGFITHSPFAVTQVKRAVRTYAPGFLTSQEVEALAQAARDRYGVWGEVMACGILVSAWTCVRPGELFGLRISDVDFSGDDDLDLPEEYRTGSISFDTQIGRNGERVPTKTNDQRHVILPAPAAQAIRDSRDAVAALGGGDLLICNLQGKPMRQVTWQLRWDVIRKDIGRPDLVYYALRHFGATYLREIGVGDTDIAAQLGHSDTKLVNSTYTHADVKHSHARIRTAHYAADQRALARAEREPRDLAVVAGAEPAAAPQVVLPAGVTPELLAQALTLVTTLAGQQQAA